MSTILQILGSTSTIFGLLAIGLYFYFRLATKALIEKSIKDSVGIEQHFNAEQILGILKEFKDDQSRLIALQKLTALDIDKAQIVLDGLKSSSTMKNLSSRQQGQRQAILIGSAAVLIAVGLISLTASKLRSELITPTLQSSFTTQHPSIKDSQRMPNFQDWDSIEAFNTSNVNSNGVELISVDRNIVEGHFRVVLPKRDGAYSSGNVVFKDKISPTFCILARLYGREGIRTVEMGSKNGLAILEVNSRKFMLYESESNLTAWKNTPEMSKDEEDLNELMICFEPESISAFLNRYYLGSLEKRQPYEESPAGAFFKANNNTGGEARLERMIAYRKK